MSLLKKLEKGIFQVGSISLIESFIKIISIALLARVISPTDFGYMSITLLTVTTASLLAKFGVPSAIVQKKDLDSNDFKTGFLISLCLGLFFTFFTYHIGDSVAKFFDTLQAADAIKTTSFIILIESIYYPFQAMLQRRLKYKIVAFISLSSYTFGYLVVAFCLSQYDFGVFALVYAYLCQSLWMLLLTIYFTNLYFSDGGRVNRKSIFELLRFGFGFTIAKFGNQTANEGGNFVVGKCLGSDSLGEFSKASQIYIMPANLIAGIVDKVTFPLMSTVQDKPDELKKIYLYALELMTIISIPLMIFLNVLSKEVIFLFLGEQWGNSVEPFSILVLGLYFRMAYRVSDSLSRAMGRVYKRALIQWVYALVVIVGAYIGSGYGLNGIAFAVILGTLINFLLLINMTNKLINVTLRDYLNTFHYSFKFGLITIFSCLMSLSLGFDYLFTLVISVVTILFLIGLISLISKEILFGFYFNNLEFLKKG